jgi:type II secretory pathway pseudopilin PulG
MLIESSRCCPTTALPSLREVGRNSLRARRRRFAGFTLVEAMMATVIFTMATIGIYTMLIKSYQMSALARCRDEARAVLRTYADQFLRLETTAEETVPADPSAGTPETKATFNRWLFNPTSGPSGRGLVWGALNLNTTFTPATDVPYLDITLGTGSHAVPAKLTRDVGYVTASTGATSGSQQIGPAGFIIRATFAVSYSLGGKDYSQSVTVVRLAP